MPAAPITANVTSNDTHPQGVPFTVTSNTAVSPSSAGTLTDGVNPDGSFTFTPDPNFSGVATFDYTITDSNGLSDTATVTLTIPDCSGGGSSST